jgi:hypothetical protein
MPGQYRQGDVLLCPIERVPAAAYRVRIEGERVVVAEGELSGHAHAFARKGVRLFRDKKSHRDFLMIGKAGAQLRHEEHGTIPVAEGCYEIRRQREYTPRSPRLLKD